MRVISYYTNEFYKAHATLMAESAKAVGLTDVTLYPGVHSNHWWENTNQKCRIVRQALLDFPGEAVLFQDADTRFLQYPELLRAMDGDFATYFPRFNVPSGGTLWFGGRRAKRLVDQWCANVAEHPDWEDDSINFAAAIKKINPTVQALPPAYCWDESFMRILFPTAEPVIIHGFVGDHNYPVNP